MGGTVRDATMIFLLGLYTMYGLIKYLQLPAWHLCDLTGLPTERAQTFESEN